MTLRYSGRSLTVPFYFGMGHDGKVPPEAHVVLWCLLTDANGAEQGFEGWCADYGYDTDSRKAYALWEGCAATAPKLRKLLGRDVFRALLAEDEDGVKAFCHGGK